MSHVPCGLRGGFISRAQEEHKKLRGWCLYGFVKLGGALVYPADTRGKIRNSGAGFLIILLDCAELLASPRGFLTFCFAIRRPFKTQHSGNYGCARPPASNDFLQTKRYQNEKSRATLTSDQMCLIQRARCTTKRASPLNDASPFNHHTHKRKTVSRMIITSIHIATTRKAQ